MKNKDQILLENLYKTVSEDRVPNLDVPDDPQWAARDTTTSFADKNLEPEDDENEDELFVGIAAEFLSRANPSDKIFDLLSEVKEKGMVRELVDFLNKLGEEDENNWVAKDKLIEFLFKYYS